MEIIFVDDELQRIEVYIEDLEIAFEQSGDKLSTVCGFDNLGSAYEYIRNRHEGIDLVVLDVMMPGGIMFHEKDEDPMGLKSGFYFYKEIRALYPHLKVQLFTNVTDLEIEESIESDPCAWIAYKDELLPFELTRRVMSMK